MLVQKAIVRRSYVIDCRIWLGKRKKNLFSQAHENSMKNLNLKYTKGDITQSARKKILKIAETYLTTISINNVIRNRNGLRKTRIPVFITLTYPSVPTQSDNELKRRHLGEFTKWLTRTKDCKAYIWRAETQQNGNLHFHIFTDKFIAWTDVRAVWNSIVGKDGYVEEFRKMHGHANPNSTDIELIEDINVASAYIAKYLTKDSYGEARKQQGRVWGCSDNIRKIEPYHETQEDRLILLEGLNDEGAFKEIIKVNDFVSIYKMHKNFVESSYKSKYNVLGNYEKYYQNLAQSLNLF